MAGMDVRMDGRMDKLEEGWGSWARGWAGGFGYKDE